MSQWKQYRKTAAQEMRPYVPGESLAGVSVNTVDSPEKGGMIARNARNHADQWYVAKEFFEDNYERSSCTCYAYDTEAPSTLATCKERLAQ